MVASVPEVQDLHDHDRAVTELKWRIADLQGDLEVLEAKRPELLRLARLAIHNQLAKHAK